MVNIHSNGNKTAYGIKHYDLDAFEDLEKISVRNLTPGSTVFIINSSTYYMLNGKRRWVKINPYGMNDGSSDSDLPKDVTYEGGVV